MIIRFNGSEDRNHHIIPWSDYAIAVERRDGKSIVICEGTLAEVVSAVKILERPRLACVMIALSDRGAAPYTFEGCALESLTCDPTRPVTSPVRLLPIFNNSSL